MSARTPKQTEVEAVLLEYVEIYGLTESARQLFATGPSDRTSVPRSLSSRGMDLAGGENCDANAHRDPPN